MAGTALAGGESGIEVVPVNCQPGWWLRANAGADGLPGHQTHEHEAGRRVGLLRQESGKTSSAKIFHGGLAK